MKKSTWHKNRLAREKAAFALAYEDDIADKHGIWATFESDPSVDRMEPLLSIWDALPPSLTGKNAADIKSAIFSDNGNAIITLESTLDDWDKNESEFACRRDIHTLRIHATSRGETVKWWLNGGVRVCEVPMLSADCLYISQIINAFQRVLAARAQELDLSVYFFDSHFVANLFINPNFSHRDIRTGGLNRSTANWMV